MAARIGTAGWSIHSRHGEAFPGEGSHLQRYARQMDAAEINSSFHRPHRRETYARWAQAVPEGFRFAVKMPKTITHERRLLDSGDLMARFAGEIGGLGDKLGVVLVQLPPSLAFDAPVADDFFRLLVGQTHAALACEPRHGSWFSQEAETLLSGYRVARVAADPARFPGAGAPGGWPGLAYFRWHGSPAMYRSSYDMPAIAALVQNLRHLASAGAATWCIFDNTTFSHALENAATASKLMMTNISK